MIRYLKYLIFISSIANCQKQEIDCEYFIEIRQNQKFIGGEAIIEFENGYDEFFKNLKYPKEAIEENIEGTVIIWFVIDTLGNPQCIEILKPLGYGCDESVVNAINISKIKPIITPRGKKVAMAFSMPVNFKLKKESKMEKIIEKIKSVFIE